MPKYLIEGRYTADGTKGLVKEGGTSRVAAVEHLIQGLGGKVDGFYYAFGETDVYVIVNMPDNVSITAATLAVNAAGAVALRTTVLLTPAEIDAAAKKTADYRPPGA